MSPSTSQKVAVDDGEIVVFLVGMTFNRPWKIRSWWPVFSAMPKMLRELQANPELGLLSTSTTFGLRGPIVVQYWRSPEHLERFARGRDHSHMPAWAAFMKTKAATNGDVGLWHETYVTRPGIRENLYLSTPRIGFAKAAATYRPVSAGEETARKRRLGREATAAPQDGAVEAPTPAADTTA
ncbi:MAG: DUF4188 domain-containing protein [Patulibacter sp.]|nr:DUF4188 domain-containing protein [Patulibacter sp.]